MNPTRQKILAASEIEFAMHGFNGATIRDITRRAEVNIAAINYHFGNKADLFKEMVRNRIEPINELRLKQLDEALIENKGKPLPIERIVGIIVRPLLTSLLREGSDQLHFMKAMGKGLVEDQDFMKNMHRDILKTVIERFTVAISDSLDCPQFPKMTYGMHFLSCTIAGTMLQHAKLSTISGGKIDLNDVDSLVDHLVAYISGGFRSIASMETRKVKGEPA